MRAVRGFGPVVSKSKEHTWCGVKKESDTGSPRGPQREHNPFGDAVLRLLSNSDKFGERLARDARLKT